MILSEQKAAASTMAWILALIVIPLIGLVGYLLFGFSWKNRILAGEKSSETPCNIEMLPGSQDSFIKKFSASQEGERELYIKNAKLLHRLTGLPVSEGNYLKTYFSGAEKYKNLLADIRAAQNFIYMEYYIWRSDETGKQVLKALKERAKAGVKIQLLFDGCGSLTCMSRSYRHALKKAGIDFSFSMGLNTLFSRLRINYRNHRKIVVIDGNIGYVGGMNLGTEHITGGKAFASWRDTHLRIVGPAVSMLERVFSTDWQESGKEPLSPKEKAGKEGTEGLQDQGRGAELDGAESGTETQTCPIQIIFSGPDTTWESIRLSYLEMINSAQHEILIQTPYYIPSGAIDQAMISAALRGVRVILMTIGSPPDQKLPFWAAQTYFGPLLNAGVEIYRYQSGFLHAKVLIQDRLMTSVGSCNFDVRSFSLNYEINAVIYSQKESTMHAEHFFEDIKHCHRKTLVDCKQNSPLARMRNNAARMLSPLM